MSYYIKQDKLDLAVDAMIAACDTLMDRDGNRIEFPIKQLSRDQWEAIICGLVSMFYSAKDCCRKEGWKDSPRIAERVNES